jgi:hypothetical protein
VKVLIHERGFQETSGTPHFSFLFLLPLIPPLHLGAEVAWGYPPTPPPLFIHSLIYQSILSFFFVDPKAAAATSPARAPSHLALLCRPLLRNARQQLLASNIVLYKVRTGDEIDRVTRNCWCLSIHSSEMT